jgi:tape measure domain-containing protein
MPQNFDIKTTFRAVDKSTQAISKIQNRLMKLTARGSMAMRRLDRTMSRVSKTLTTGIRRGAFLAAAGITALAGATWKVMQQFSKIEDAEAAFTPLLGGAKKATEMVKALNETAATTPFQFENLAGAAKQLLPNMGGDIQKTIETIRMLGDTAGGNAQKMDSIVRGYNKALLKGKVDMESLNMIAEAGVPIFNDLGSVVGKSGTKLFKAISAGKISTEDLTKAFKKMTGKGGIFFEGMKIASETLSGKVSTLKDNVGLAAAELGTVLAPILKDTTDYLIDVSRQARQWIIQNKAIIKTKLDEFIKKIPDYLEKIVYWGPKIAYLVGTFYAITGAVKIANGAMTLFNTLANINLGPLKAVGAFMGKTLPMKIGTSTAAVGVFQTALVGLGAFVAGWAIGTILYEKLVDPLIAARGEALRLRDELEDTLSKDLSKRNTAMLQSDIEKADKAIDLEKKMPTPFHVASLSHYGAGAISQIQMVEAITRAREGKAALQSAKYFRQQQENIERYSGDAPVSDEWSMSTQSPYVTKSVSSHKEEVEITIKDETTGKRATVTKGSSGRLKLVHTGAMP